MLPIISMIWFMVLKTYAEPFVNDIINKKADQWNRNVTIRASGGTENKLL